MIRFLRRTRAMALACVAAFASALVLMACSTAPTGAPSSGGSGLPCAIADVLERHCHACHGEAPQYGAPMSLVTHRDLVAPSPSDGTRPVYELVGMRIHDDVRPMPKPPNPRLDEAEAAALDAWIDAGAPERAAGEACAPPRAETDPSALLGCAPDLQIRPAAPYVLPADVTDALVCYGWESPHGSKRHITGLAPSISARGQLHHVTLLQSDVAVSPVPGPCSPQAMSAWRPLYGWAPGARGLELPPEAGLPEGPGTHFVVQLHFANPRGERVEDASGFDLCTTEELRPNDADVMAFGTMEITVPPRGSLDVDCSVPVPADGATTHLFAAFPHMHELGTSIRTVVRPGGSGDPVDLGTVTAWDLGNQTWLPIDYTLRPGDVVESRCSWNNPYDHGVGYGPTADDEMCFSYVMYFPRIEASTWHWSLPALYSTCR